MTKQVVLGHPEVPHEIVDSGTYSVGARARADGGIESVTFTATGPDGTATSTITAQSSYTKHASAIWCFNTTLDLSSVGDGMVTITITATPVEADVAARTLSYEVLNNVGGTFNPRQWVYVDPVNGDDTNSGILTDPLFSIHRALRRLAELDLAGDVGGHFVYLLAGRYEGQGFDTPYPTASRSFVEILPAPGVDRSEVTLATGLLRVRNVSLLKIHGIQIENTTIDAAATTSGSRHLWLSDCLFTGAQPIDSNYGLDPYVGWDEVYLTGTEIDGWRRNVTSPRMMRNCVLRNAGEVSINKPTGWHWNNEVESLWPAATLPEEDGGGLYSSVIRLGSAENMIMEGLRVTGIEKARLIDDPIGATLENCLFHNVLLAHGGDYPTIQSSRLRGPHTHVFFDHVTVANQALYLEKDNGFDPVDVQVGNCLFRRLALNGDGDGIEILGTHYHDAPDDPSLLPGSTGDPEFIDPPGLDYRIASGSPAEDQGDPSIPAADGPRGNGSALTNPGALGEVAAPYGFSEHVYYDGVIGSGSPEMAPIEASGDGWVSVVPIWEITGLGAATYTGATVEGSGFPAGITGSGTATLGPARASGYPGGTDAGVGSNEIHPLILEAWPVILNNMEWGQDAGKVNPIANTVIMSDPPPNAHANDLYFEAFAKRADGRWVKTALRVTLGDPDPNIDMWFVFGYGHEGTRQGAWTTDGNIGGVNTPEPIFLADIQIAHAAARALPAIGHGQALATSVRITVVSASPAFTLGEVMYRVFPGPHTMTGGRHPVGDHLSGTAENKRLTFLDQLNGVRQIPWEYFRDNGFATPNMGRTGDQTRFGMDVLGWLDWCAQDDTAEGVEATKLLMRLFYNKLHWLYHYIKEDGSFWDPTDPKYDEIVFYNSNILGSDAPNLWYDPGPAARDWQTGTTYSQSPPSHHVGHNDLVQLFKRTADPVLWWEVKWTKRMLWTQTHLVNVGSSMPWVGGLRSRCRALEGLMSLMNAYEGHAEFAEIEERALGLLRLQYAVFVQHNRLPIGIDPNATNYKLSPWMWSMYTRTMNLARQLLPLTAQDDADLAEMQQSYYEWLLTWNWSKTPTGQYACYYEVGPDGKTSLTPSYPWAGYGISQWGVALAFDQAVNRTVPLSSALNAECDEIYQQYAIDRTSVLGANQWDPGHRTLPLIFASSGPDGSGTAEYSGATVQGAGNIGGIVSIVGFGTASMPAGDVEGVGGMPITGENQDGVPATYTGATVEGSGQITYPSVDVTGGGLAVLAAGQVEGSGKMTINGRPEDEEGNVVALVQAAGAVMGRGTIGSARSKVVTVADGETRVFTFSKGYHRVADLHAYVGGVEVEIFDVAGDLVTLRFTPDDGSVVTIQRITPTVARGRLEPGGAVSGPQLRDMQLQLLYAWEELRDSIDGLL